MIASLGISQVLIQKDRAEIKMTNPAGDALTLTYRARYGRYDLMGAEVRGSDTLSGRFFREIPFAEAERVLKLLVQDCPLILQ